MNTSSSRRLSLGALSLILALALPVGVMGLFSEATTGEQVDLADVIFLGRVSSMQGIDRPRSTVVEFDVLRPLLRQGVADPFRLRTEHRLPLDVGDLAVVLVDSSGPTLLGRYLARKNAETLAYEVVTPITGMHEQGIDPASGQPVSLAVLSQAIYSRKVGQLAAGLGAPPFGGGGGAGAGAGAPPAPGGGLGGSPGSHAGSDSRAGSARADGAAQGGGRAEKAPPSFAGDAPPAGPDRFEPNDTLATATPITGLSSPHMMTGFPTLLTGLTLTVINNMGDVDFFEFSGAELSILHASTFHAHTSETPDTFMGLFHAGTGELLAHDDDGSPQPGFSSLVVPLEQFGPYAVAVESAPDSDLSFTGNEAATTGDYGLSLELEKGSYLWNALDMIMGVSADGTYIEDFIGFKAVGGRDMLRAGVPADGWGLRFDVDLPSGVTHIYGGAGDHLSDPGFSSPALVQSLTIGPFYDANGFNRAGRASSSVLVAYSTDPPLGVQVVHDYQISVGERLVKGLITLQNSTPDTVAEVSFARVLDMDLFGSGDDTFHWSFDPASRTQAFAVGGDQHVGNLTPPANPVSSATGDLQAALVIEQGAGPVAPSGYRTGFAMTSDAPSEMEAVRDVQSRLGSIRMDTWVIAVDQDPDSGLWAAFGAGLLRMP